MNNTKQAKATQYHCPLAPSLPCEGKMLRMPMPLDSEWLLLELSEGMLTTIIFCPVGVDAAEEVTTFRRVGPEFGVPGVVGNTEDWPEEPAWRPCEDTMTYFCCGVPDRETAPDPGVARRTGLVGGRPWVGVVGVPWMTNCCRGFEKEKKKKTSKGNLF